MEQWKELSGFEGLYRISNLGNVCSTKTNILLKGSLDKDGYKRVALYNNSGKYEVKLHRLVATLFVPNPNGFPQVNHKNGIKTDNTAENLEWCDSLHNTQHAIKNGLLNPKGDSNGRSKISEEEVLKAREMYTTGNYTAKQINNFLGRKVHDAIMCGILSGRYWKHLPFSYTKQDKHKHRRKLSSEQELEVINMYDKGFLRTEIKKKFGVSMDTINRVLFIRRSQIEQNLVNN